MLELILVILRFITLMISVVGYIMLARQLLSIHPKFGWIFVLSGITCILYFSGLAGLLLYASYAVFVLGLVLFIWFLAAGKRGLLFQLKALNLLNTVFLLGFGVIFASLITTRYMHYDNFSHWGLVVKYMLLTDAFPNAASAIIDFKTYPLGSSTFLYYVCKIAGSSEGVMLVAQASLIFACFYAMFGVIRDTKRFLLCSAMALCCAAMTFFNISIRINNLLVDFLLPLLTLAVLSILFVYRHDVRRACIVSLPVLALLVIVKNSGIFFALLCYLYLLYTVLRKKQRQKKSTAFLLAALAIAVSLSTFAAWNLHVSAEFKGEKSKHTMSVENFNEVSSEKTPEIRAEIVHRFQQAVFNRESLATRGIVLFQILALAAYLTARLLLKKKWALLKVLFWADAAVVLYYAGILAMFIFTMPTEEALILAGFERYASSIVVFLIGALALCGVHDIENSFHVQQGTKRDSMAFKNLLTKNIYEMATIFLIAASLTVLLSEVNGMNSMKAAYPDSIPGKVSRLTGDHWASPDQSRYLFYASDADSQITSYYLQYTARYFLFAAQVDAVDRLEDADFKKKLEKYDYLVVLESDGAIREFMKKYGKTGEDITGIYPVQETFRESRP